MTTQPAAVAADEYTRFCDSMLALTDLDLAQYKRTQLERRVKVFADRAGCGSLAEYQSLLERDESARAGFLDRLTINVSQLWRNPEQWSVLQASVLPELAKAGRLRVLCAGVSYGAEAYTLAALCADTLDTATVKVEILGTDIDARMIERAEIGEFSEAEARDAPVAALERNFERTQTGWLARPSLRELVSFEVSDLLRAELAPDSLDLILCRNTIIYFEPPVRDHLHAMFSRALRDDGRLVVGSTERVRDPQGQGLASEFPFVYRKVARDGHV